MNTVEYKGYVGRFELHEGDDEFHGRVINTRDVIHFSGSSVQELRRSLADVVDLYLETCEEEGIEPDRPFSGDFRVRMPEELHRRLYIVAEKRGASMNQLAVEAIEKETGG